MSDYLLDTNIPSELIKTRPDPQLSSWVATQSNSALHISVITIGELRKGIEILPGGKRRSSLETWLDGSLIPSFENRVLPVTQAIADRWGSFSARRQITGRPLSMADGLIAATAFENSLTLVTRNIRDYAGLGVDILEPWQSV